MMLHTKEYIEISHDFNDQTIVGIVSLVFLPHLFLFLFIFKDMTVTSPKLVFLVKAKK